MADYLTRLGETIAIDSPSGNIFTAKWEGDDRTVENKVGIHEFPNVIGAKVQSQGPGAFIYPLTFNFGGKDNDLDSSDFMDALRDEYKDKWKIQHPTKGPIFLTWIGAIERIQPVKSGGLTKITVNWIEGLPDSEEEAAAQAQAQAEFQSDQANAAASDQFEENAVQDTPADRQSLIDSVSNAITKINSTLSLIENFDIIPDQLEAIAAAIDTALEADFIDGALLAGQMQAYTQLFGLGQNNSKDGVSMYSDLVDNMLTESPDQPTSGGKSEIAVTELVVSAAIVGAGQMSLIGGLASRSEVITVAEANAALFETATEGLDETQAIYADNSIDTIYWSQSSAYADMLKMISDSNRFLYLSLFGLPSERRIILKEDKFTGQIAKDEYGNINQSGDDLENLWLLIDSNDWHGNDIYMQPAGTEVLIYQ